MLISTQTDTTGSIFSIHQSMDGFDVYRENHNTDGQGNYMEGDALLDTLDTLQEAEKEVDRLMF